MSKQKYYKREKVKKLLDEGLSYAQIRQRLGCCPKTIYDCKKEMADEKSET